VESSKKFTFREVNGDELVETFVGNPVRAVDEAALGRLRDAIAAEDVEEEQLKGVLRMLAPRQVNRLLTRSRADRAAADPGGFELLAREQEDALVQLAAIRTLRGWLGGRERLSLAAARAQEYS
jgi:hypothetical protein